MSRETTSKDSLDRILASAWGLLRRGVERSGDPFHRPVLGTGSGDGCNLRTVILRGADEAGRTLICYSDARAAKVAEIGANRTVCWLFYHPRRKIQLRIGGPARVHTGDALADTHWRRVKGPGRLNYCTEAPPGSPLNSPSSGLSERLVNNLSGLLRGSAGREHFAVIAAQVSTIDWLHLRPSGNLRARFAWEAGRLIAAWVVP